jgi:benzoyl-CoA reductase/2-hydroxyglutaryl-CoA dehydratase subunit BcrC/BadD/HgdB
MRYAAALVDRSDSLPVFLMNVPSTWQTAPARQLYSDEIRRLGRFLVRLGGKSPTDGELAEVMLGYERGRRTVREARDRLWARQFAAALAELRGDGRPTGGKGGSPAVVCGNKGRQAAHGTQAFHSGQAAHGTQAQGVPLALVGGPLLEEDDAILDLVERAGGRVVLDGTEGGERTLPAPWDRRRLQTHPLGELCRAYFAHFPDPFRRPNHELYEWLGREASARGVRGIILRRYLWCDLWHAELDRLRHWSPVPILDLDVAEHGHGAMSRTSGRLEAFLETLPALGAEWLGQSGAVPQSFTPRDFAAISRQPPVDSTDRKHYRPAARPASPPGPRALLPGPQPEAPSPQSLVASRQPPAPSPECVARPPIQPRRITLAEWGRRYAELCRAGLCEPRYGGPLGRHVDDGDLRLANLRLDDSVASLRLWNFLLTEEERLHQARAEGKRILGAMKDLGTVPVMAYSLPDVVAFYPDGAWWIPCVMQRSAGLLEIADALGIDDSFCPVRAMLGAFVNRAHFPVPGLLTCSVGATCDDFSAIAQRLEALGHPIVWWEIPHRRPPDPQEPSVRLPGGFGAPESQVALVRSELQRVRRALEVYTGDRLTDRRLSAGIRRANRVRRLLSELRRLVFIAKASPLPALETLIAEMLAIHFCSDQDETIRVLEELLGEVRGRVRAGVGVLPPDAVRVFWVNPVADLRVMNLLEDAGGRVCGTEYLFSHALDPIPEDLPPMEALARMALADPMVGSAADRAERIRADVLRFGAEAVVISHIPGASHCAMEGAIMKRAVFSRLAAGCLGQSEAVPPGLTRPGFAALSRRPPAALIERPPVSDDGGLAHPRLAVPVTEIEVPPVADPMEPTLRTRLEAIVETVRERRRQDGPSPLGAGLPASP